MHARNFCSVNMVYERNASLTEQKARCMQVASSRLCCIDDNNNQTFNGVEAGSERSSCYEFAVENNASLIKIEAGLIHGILSTYKSTKVMCL